MFKYIISLFCFIYFSLAGESFGAFNVKPYPEIEPSVHARSQPSVSLPNLSEFEDSLRHKARVKLEEYMVYTTYILWYRVARFTLGLAFPWIPSYGLELASIGTACLAPQDPFDFSLALDQGVNTVFHHPLVRYTFEFTETLRKESFSLASTLWSRTSRAFW